MTEQDKKLLLQDLCARLPYGIIVEVMDINDSAYHKKVFYVKYQILIVIVTELNSCLR